MFSAIALLVLLGLGLVALNAAQAARLRRVALGRIGIQTQSDPEVAALFGAAEQRVPVYPRRLHFAGPVAGALAAAGVFWGTNLPAPYAVGAGALMGAIAYLLEIRVADKKIERIEEQLADGIDMMVASLRAGSALLAALEATHRESRPPMKMELETIVGRIRVGEDPRDVVRELAFRVPLESFRLFSHTLLVHWETGGSLASSLRTIGRTVRDRLEVSRRINAQAVESQISVVAVLLITYGLAAFMMNANPGPFLKLIYSLIGSYIAGALMILQAIGMVWIWRMSRIRF